LKPQVPDESPGSAAPTSAGSAAIRAGSPAVIPVGLLVGSARLILERHLGLVWVSGELSNFTRAASGHCYFNLKDASAQVRCVFFRQKAQFAGFALKDGLAVEVRATASIYEARGEFQLNVETIRLAGIGALYEKFERLKARLAAAGFFATERKRPLPAFPRAVGIVTSTRAAALSDILTTLRRRWPAIFSSPGPRLPPPFSAIILRGAIRLRSNSRANEAAGSRAPLSVQVAESSQRDPCREPRSERLLVRRGPLWVLVVRKRPRRALI